MRSRRSSQEQVAEVARRRFQQLSAELAELRSESEGPPAGLGAVEPGAAPAEPAAPSRGAPPSLPGRHAQRSVGLAASTAGWAHDRLPPALQGRVRLRSG